MKPSRYIGAFLANIALLAIQSHAAKPLPKPTPKGSFQTLMSTDDYPAAALRANEQGMTAVRLDVDRDGHVTACVVIHSSGSPLLDETTCTLFKSRASFNPATDKHGQAVASSYASRMTWRIPEGEPDKASMITCAGGMPSDVVVVTPLGCAR